ncbi:unnamed protein product [Moneuplotes crassus]|uniref:Uncharacterized protein n=1 Tax=Euplotes crassus TaxID=5936 RepID=A0AAD1Y0Z9_EUPCR|nr:unnamed protein product [Moneuplotes crassus]
MQEVVTTTFFHSLNLVLVIIDIAAIFGAMIAFPDARVFGTLALIHVPFLFPSLVYHMVPAVRHNFVFRWISHLLSSLVLGLFVITIVLYIFMMDDRQGGPAMLLVILGITGPGALISGSLLLMLNSEAQRQQIRYVVVQKEAAYEPIMMI